MSVFETRPGLLNARTCRSGGIGIRVRLRTVFLYRIVGSSPTFGTHVYSIREDLTICLPKFIKLNQQLGNTCELLTVPRYKKPRLVAGCFGLRKISGEDGPSEVITIITFIIR